MITRAAQSFLGRTDLASRDVAASCAGYGRLLWSGRRESDRPHSKRFLTVGTLEGCPGCVCGQKDGGIVGHANDRQRGVHKPCAGLKVRDVGDSRDELFCRALSIGKACDRLRAHLQRFSRNLLQSRRHHASDHCWTVRKPQNGACCLHAGPCGAPQTPAMCLAHLPTSDKPPDQDQRP